ncbi:GNAT family N-acetyltransferase [Clostridium sp. CF012]|uniref:GNAT family N-acetyltransferase n=1 Tax=Clostridium sp. CF012 TaxID=2843319 RepID=UPI001C0AAE06|nr:GNAT family N-acetyltransferase [Clostridium sp. CF012]MBU3144078.1 GNAT family N-acetyltransferase [Clostridium sp. CF012]
MIYYQNNEIVIRDIGSSDVINLFSWQIDKELNKHDPRPIPNNSKELIEECINYCRRFDTEIMSENIQDIEYKYFIITDYEDNAIGFVNFFSIDKLKKQGEMGVTIGDKRYWNKGIAYTSVKIAVYYIFNNMDIDRIYIETGECNKPALRLFEKLDFKRCDEYIEDENFKFIVMEKVKSGF